MTSKRCISFDTLKYANRLKAVGVPEKQAEMQAELQAETITKQAAAVDDVNNLIDNSLATKQDTNEIKKDIVELKQDMTEVKKDITELKLLIPHMGYKIIVVLVGVLCGMITVLGFLVKAH